MLTQINQEIHKSAKPVAAGILSIVAGGGNILGALVLGIGGLIFGSLSGYFFPGFLGLLLAFPMLIVGVLSIIGGVFAIQRRRWSWALAGSIATLVTSSLLGIAAIILLAISKDEFQMKGNQN